MPASDRIACALDSVAVWARVPPSLGGAVKAGVSVAPATVSSYWVMIRAACWRATSDCCMACWSSCACCA